jgi:hypothetical protein
MVVGPVAASVGVAAVVEPVVTSEMSENRREYFYLASTEEVCGPNFPRISSRLLLDVYSAMIS